MDDQFPEGTIINFDHTTVESTIKDLPNKGQVRFIMKRKQGMWGKRLYVYHTNTGEKIVSLELGHDQNGMDQLDVRIDKRATDFKGRLAFELWHVGGAGVWHEDDQPWEFTGETVAGKEITIEWQRD